MSDNAKLTLITDSLPKQNLKTDYGKEFNKKFIEHYYENGKNGWLHRITTAVRRTLVTPRTVH